VTTEPIIALNDLGFSYNGPASKVLRGLTLEVPAGSVTAILGPNGSGKTTLIYLLMGILAPQSGSIRLEGRPREEYTRPALSRLMGLVPQEERIPFDLSVMEYVLLGRAPHLGTWAMPSARDEGEARASLEATGLLPLQGRGVNSLSGGERQMATVARALTQGPRILLLDEPTAHLDLSNRGRILGLMRELAHGGVTVLFTTHDPNAASTVADYVILLREGEALAAGPADEVLTATNLSATYGIPVEVARVGNRAVIV
jgi:iron complex transport system ATP-binding protein